MRTVPPLPNAASCLKVRFVGNNQGFPWNCILHTQYTGPVPQTTDLTNYANLLATAWNNDVAPLCATQIALTSVDVIDLSSPTSASSTVTVNHAGSRVGSPLPASTALVSSWLAPLRYRGGHPRNYWPGGVQTDLGNVASWLGASLTAFQSGFAAFFTAINAAPVAGGSAHLILLSYKSGGALRPTPLPVIVQGVTVHPRIDSQRKRLGKEHP
jgi:hypothetical protein